MRNLLSRLIDLFRRKPKRKLSGLEELAEIQKRTLEEFKRISDGRTVWDEPMDRRRCSELGYDYIPSAGASETGVLSGHRRHRRPPPS